MVVFFLFVFFFFPFIPDKLFLEDSVAVCYLRR